MDTSTNEEEKKLLETKKASYLKDITRYHQEIKTKAERFDNMPALSAKFSVSEDSAQQVLAYQEANKDFQPKAGNVFPSRFQRAMIVDSFLNISPKTPKSSVTRNVINVSFPGGEVATRDLENPNGYRVGMNGGLSGLVEISTSLYCTRKDLNESMEKAFYNLVALNMDYSVKAQAGLKVSLHAELQVKDLIKELSAFIKKGRWRRDEWTTAVLSGAVNKFVKIVIDDKGSSPKSLELNDILESEKSDGSGFQFVGKVIQQDLKNFTDQVQTVLDDLHVTKPVEQLTPQEIQNGVEDVLTGWTTACSSSSSWFGAWSSSSCSTSPIYVRYDRDGFSQLTNSNQANLVIKVIDEIESNRTEVVKHQTSFDENIK
jgi:hypothetical protein